MVDGKVNGRGSIRESNSGQQAAAYKEKKLSRRAMANKSSK